MALLQTNNNKLEIERGIFLSSGFYAWIVVNHIYVRNNSISNQVCDIDARVEFYIDRSEKISKDQSTIRPPFYSKQYNISTDDPNFSWSPAVDINTYSNFIKDLSEYFARTYSNVGVECNVVDIS